MHRLHRCARRPDVAIAFLVSCFALQACGNESSTNPTTPGSYSLSASPGSLLILPGDTNAVRIDIARMDGFTGAVTFGVSGVPAGLSANITTSGVTSDFAVLRVTTIANMPQGVVTLTVNGTAVGQPPKAVAVAFTVGPAPALALTASPIRMLQGGNGETAISVARSNGLIGSVTYTSSGVPSGLTASITSAGTNALSATLALTSRSTVTPGLVTLTVTGMVDGRALGAVNIPVEIVPFTGGTGNVTVDFSNCPTAGKPVWFAYQDSNGTWTQTLPTADVYRFNVTGTKGGYAFSLGGSPFHVSTRLLTLEELKAPENQMVCPAAPSGSTSKTVRGTFTDFTTGGRNQVGLGGASMSIWDYGATAGDFQLNDVPAGPQDLIAYRQYANGSVLNDRAIIRRDLDIAHNGQLTSIDFNSSEAFVPASATIVVRGATGPLQASMGYRTGAQCVLNGLTNSDPEMKLGSAIRGIPAARQRAGDFHSLSVWEYGDTTWRLATQNFHALADQVFELPPLLAAPAVSVVPGAYPRLQAVLTVPAEYNRDVSFSYGFTSIAASRAWLGATTFTLTPPDLSGVTGFRRSASTSSGLQNSWTVRATGESGYGINGACTEGSRAIEAGLTGRT